MAQQPFQFGSARDQRLVEQVDAAAVASQIEGDEVRRVLPDDLGEPASRGQPPLQQGEVAAAVAGVPDQDFTVDNRPGWQRRGERIVQIGEVPGQVGAVPRLDPYPVGGAPDDGAETVVLQTSDVS
jgi:hypothetical protein